MPAQPDKPIDYYHGLSLEDRIVSRNVVFFERRSEEKLRKKSLRSRLHHRYVLIRVAKTSGSINIDGFNFDLAESDVVLISPFQFHHYSELQAPALHWQFITFELTQGADRLRRMNSPVQKLGTADIRLWDKFLETWRSDNEVSRLESLPILDRLLMRLCFAGSQQADRPQLRKEESPWIPQAESLIIQSIREGRNLEDVAQQLNVSDRQFRARFKAALEISPKDYRTRYQLHSAISLMQNEKLKLSAIAEMAGFNSQPAFTRFIKKLTNLSPKELRQQVREGEFRMKI
ncbi:MAG: helix-turn-helix domain-containing protein [Puniceicoccaceae bacterium]